LSPGYAKFYIFIRNEISGTVVNCSILNPGGNTFNSWTYNVNGNYNGAYFGFSKLLPVTAGVYTFQATYNGITCSQNFTITTTTGIENNPGMQQIQVYPNPANEKIIVSGDGIDNGIYTFCMKNILGQKVFEEKASYENNLIRKSISLSALSNGIYFLTIENEKGNIVKKIIKEN
jgi:hypothetical protein